MSSHLTFHIGFGDPNKFCSLIRRQVLYRQTTSFPVSSVATQPFPGELAFIQPYLLAKTLDTQSTAWDHLLLPLGSAQLLHGTFYSFHLVIMCLIISFKGWRDVKSTHWLF